MASFKQQEQAAKVHHLSAVEAFEYVHGFRDRNTTIPEAEDRAMTISQVRYVYKQVILRCEKEGWKSVLDGSPLTPDKVTLYDAVEYIIKPVTMKRKCSYFEMIATERQKPKLFVSHWWGEPIKGLLVCLKQHAKDHKLDESNTFYWICAYANNQWNLEEELGHDDLHSSPFFKAMQKAEGTVSILDKKGVVFQRIWCGYELYESLLNNSDEYKWCVYTTCNHRLAVGLTEGNAPIDNDENSDKTKWEREQRFPKQLLESALQIAIEKAQASISVDKDRIMKNIGSANVKTLNSNLKSRFAAAGLRIMLEDDRIWKSKPKKFWKLFLKALLEGKPSTLNLDFSDSKKFRKEQQEQLRVHINWDFIKNITLNFGSLNLGDSGATRLANDWLKEDKIVNLSIAGNDIGNDGAESIGKALKISSSLTHLNLRINAIEDAGAKAIANGLESNSVLRSIHMSGNKIGDAGAKAIGKALQVNSTLVELLVGDNKIENAGAKAIADALQINSGLKLLILWGNKIGPEGGIALGKSLETNSTLKELIVSYNKIGNKGAEAIANGLKVNKSLSSLNLFANNIKKAGRKAVRSAWGKRSIDNFHL